MSPKNKISTFWEKADGVRLFFAAVSRVRLCPTANTSGLAVLFAPLFHFIKIFSIRDTKREKRFFCKKCLY